MTIRFALCVVILAGCSSGDRERLRIGQPGDVLNLKSDQVCARTEAGLDEVVKWVSRNDTDEASRSLAKDGGMILRIGEQVKVLDVGFTKARIRVVETGRECWVIREATDRSPSQ